jgi:hypothetical protein
MYKIELKKNEKVFLVTMSGLMKKKEIIFPKMLLPLGKWRE